MVWPLVRKRRVGAVLVHDREPFDAARLGAGLGDIDHAAVEIGAFAGQPLIDRIGAFVPGAAPVGRRHDEALACEFGLGGDVVEVAADRQRAVGVGLDIALHQAGGTGGGPFGEGGGGDFAERDRAGAVGAERLEQPGIAEVVADDVGELPPEHIGRAGGGLLDRGGRHGRNGDAERGRHAAGHVDHELVAGLLRGGLGRAAGAVWAASGAAASSARAEKAKRIGKSYPGNL